MSAILEPGLLSSMLGMPRVSQIGAVAYVDKLLGIDSANILAYWPSDEPSGTTFDNIEGTATRDIDNITGVALADNIGPFGSAGGYWDGTNDYARILVAGFGSFDASECTLAGWIKVEAGTWTDGVLRHAIQFENTPAAHKFLIFKAAANNTLTVQRVASASKSVSATLSPTAWSHVAMVASESDDEVEIYINGVAGGTPATGIGTWTAQALNQIRTAYGSRRSNTASQPWKGHLAHWICWNKRVSDANIAIAAAT